MIISRYRTLPLANSKEENVLVERANKEGNRHLRAFTFDSSIVDSWRALPIVQRLMNTSFCDRSKLALSQLLIVDALDLKRCIFIPALETIKGIQPLSDYIVKLVYLLSSLRVKTLFL